MIFFNFLCMIFGHEYEIKTAIVMYPLEVGGIDLYENARECECCHQKEIFHPVKKEYVKINEFDDEMSTTTIIQ